MNKQELIDKLKKQLTAPSEIDDTYFNKFYDLAINYAIYFAEQLDEPEKPVVPQFVADWYESIKDDFEYNLYKLCTDFREQKLRADLNGWFSNDNNKPIETLVLMHKFGYEVEKEKLYTVEIPNPNRADVSLVLGLYNDGKVAIFAAFTDSWKYEKQYKLTEAEIKEDFEWAWQFAKEVEE
jgi:hypothetical protein